MITGFGRAAATAAVMLFALVPLGGLAAAEPLFERIAGTWAGSGRINLTGGATEQLSCRGYYRTLDSGGSLGLAIRCASPSYKIELRSTLAATDSKVSGNWEERTFNAKGDVSGSVSSSLLNVAISGAVSGSMKVNLNGATHTVSISTQGTGFTGVTISMSRS